MHGEATLRVELFDIYLLVLTTVTGRLLAFLLLLGLFLILLLALLESLCPDPKRGLVPFLLLLDEVSFLEAVV